MYQAKKGNKWYFGLKAHIGVDRDTRQFQTLVTTAAIVSDSSQTPALLNGQQQEAWLDAGYVDVEKLEDMEHALSANEKKVKWHIAKRGKTIEKLGEGWLQNLAQT